MYRNHSRGVTHVFSIIKHAERNKNTEMKVNSEIFIVFIVLHSYTVHQ